MGALTKTIQQSEPIEKGCHSDNLNKSEKWVTIQNRHIPYGSSPGVRVSMEMPEGKSDQQIGTTVGM